MIYVPDDDYEPRSRAPAPYCHVCHMHGFAARHGPRCPDEGRLLDPRDRTLSLF